MRLEEFGVGKPWVQGRTHITETQTTILSILGLYKDNGKCQLLWNIVVI